MTAGQERLDRATWRSQAQFAARIASLRQLRAFNDTGGIAVHFDVMQSTKPDIEISGSQSEVLSFWETRSASGFITQPKFAAQLVTVRFVTSGHIVYAHRHGDILGSTTHATLAGFEDLNEVRASSAFSAVSGTIAVNTLAAANEALTGSDHPGLPQLAPVAEMSTPGMAALFCTVRLIQRRIQELDRSADLVFPLLQEVMSYQLLSAWPKRVEVKAAGAPHVPSQRLRLAIDYIDANLQNRLTLSEIASVTGVSVRSLQENFRKEIGRTPIQLIIERRLERAHTDLTSTEKSTWSIAEIARHWGFVHISDFGQRYRRLYGCTPSDTRRESGRGF
ncbi:AraC family transcriptional regulator [Methylobacterium sp. NEAU K]|uniref:helix-turn-helix transcriptional regulator n=1 Tax=Methylobacterium sp. NEAU K TaxID=3064946 RepID=UPI0027360662|nr:AraC family transcriptional regulator [Methylobacterium sp. NEAU K]MDP4003360.1 AraC family transcriptional regulator [Methylobacterium sp. NEAU K]